VPKNAPPNLPLPASRSDNLRAQGILPTELLVSVRNVPEAVEAMEGGADWMDVKEPANGPLGAASPEVVAAIAEVVGDRRPLTAALGELLELSPHTYKSWGWLEGVAIAKVGLAGCAGREGWQRTLADLGNQLPRSTKLVAVFYADRKLCDGPPASEVLAASQECGCPAFLVDTYHKKSGRLLDYLHPLELQRLFASARDRGLWPVAAGSLREVDLPQILQANPALIAVRGAVCEEGKRNGGICRSRVARLRETLSQELSRFS